MRERIDQAIKPDFINPASNQPRRWSKALRAIKTLTQPVCAGIDVGNAWTCVSTNVCDDFSFRSTAAPLTRFGDGVTGVDQKKPVIINGEPWITDFNPKLVRRYDRPIHQGAHFSPEHYALFCEAIARIGRNIDVAIVGMTVDQIGHAAALKEKLQGEHRAHGLAINVDRVGVKTQPRGTIEAYLDSLDEIRDQTVLIIDIGEGTTDVNLLTVVNDNDELMVTIDRETAFSEWVGVSKISEAIGNESSLHPAKVSELLFRQDAEILGKVEAYARPLADVISTAIKSKVQSFDDVDIVLLTGGGAHVFGRYLKPKFEGTTCKIMRNASMANARGFLLMAEHAAAA